MRSVVGYRRSYLLRAYNTLRCVGGREFLGGHTGTQVRLKCGIELTGDFTLSIGVFIVDFVVGRYTYLVRAFDCDNRGRCAGELLGKYLLEFYGAYRLLELNDVVATTREVDTLVEATAYKRYDYDCD